MNKLTNTIIAITIFLLIITAVCLYIYLKDKLERIKEVKEKTRIEKLYDDYRKLKDWQKQHQ